MQVSGMHVMVVQSLNVFAAFLEEKQQDLLELVVVYFQLLFAPLALSPAEG